MNIVPPGRNSPLLDLKLKPMQRFYQWLVQVSELSILESDGTPEGSIEAKRTRQCWDYTNNKMYVKSTNGGNTGWVALN